MSGCQRVSRLSRDQRADGTLVLSVSISTRRKLTSILLAVTIFALLAGLTSFATRGSGPITGTEGSNLACSSGESATNCSGVGLRCSRFLGAFDGVTQGDLRH